MPRRVAFVTGASSGIGAALSRRLGREGWEVGLAARRRPELETVAGEILATGGSATVHPCDVADRASVHAALADARSALGPLDLLVCNAGISAVTRPESFSAEQVERVLRVNVLGAAYALEAVLPEMLTRGRGHLVGVGSLTGYGGLPRTAAYSASKGALHNLFESLRIDLRGTGVSVTFVTPGYVRTPMTEVNLHRMPWIMDADAAADRIMAAVERRARSLAFPWPLATAVKLGQILPAGVYDWLAARVKRDKGAVPPGDPTASR